MKKSLLAVAVAAALPAAAFAQSNVTLYGLADVGVGMLDNDAPGGDKTMFVESGVQSTSRVGVRGAEDLGGGLKATFNFEMGMQYDEGLADGNLWQRKSVVGLAGNWGEVRFGRDYTAGFLAAGVSDMMGYGLYGNWLQFTAGAGGITTRASNGIHYTSPMMGGLSVRAFYSFGHTGPEAPDNKANGYGLAAVYTGGPASAQIYYQELNNAAGDAKKELGLGGGWNFGAFRVTAAYGQSEATTGVKTKGMGVGAGVKLGAGEFLVQAMQLKVDVAGDPKGTSIGLAYVHPMSKRTNLYATYGTMRNNSASAFGLMASDQMVAAGAAGADPSAFAVGIRHMF